MGQKIVIEILDKVATCLTKKPLVCGNANYEVEFVFDEEWETHNVKTAVFLVNGECIKTVFEGDVCKVPVIQNALTVMVGVFAGTINDGTLSTSTSALIRCKPCATDGDVVPASPQEDVYNQIVEMCGEAVSSAKSVEERANNGEFNGKDGEPGEKGDDGYTPQREVDYWTPADKAEMKAYIDEQIEPLREDINGAEEILSLINEGGLE